MSFLAAYFSTLRDIATDRSGALMLILSILLYSVFYPVAYSHQVTRHVPLAVVDLDHSVLSRRLVLAAMATQGVDVVRHTTSQAEGRVLLEQGEVDALLWIAPGFERDVLQGKAGEAALYGNGAYLIRTRATLTALAGALNKTAVDAVMLKLPAQGVPARAPVQLVVHPLYNSWEGYGSAIVPGVMVLVVQQTLLLGIGLMMATWHKRYGRRMGPKYFFARTAAFFTIGCGGLFYFCGMAFWQQDYPRGGNLGGLILAGPVFVLAVVMAGMFLGSFFTRREQPGQLLLATSLPIFFLTGLSWPQTVVAPWLVGLAKAFPVTSGIHLVIKLVQMDATLAEASAELYNLFLLVVLFSLMAWWRLCGFSLRLHQARGVKQDVH